MKNNLSSLYKVFSRCFYYPDDDLVKVIFDGEIIRFLQMFQLNIEADFERLTNWVEDIKFETELLQALQVEYTRLFITAYPSVLAPP